MRKTYLLLPLLLGIAATPSCSDDETETTTGGETGMPCERSEECDDGDPCTFDECIVKGDGKFCQNDQASNGAQPGDVQTDGDCKELRCVDGESVEENDDDDFGDDPDDQDCMVPACNDGTREMIPADTGDNCRVSDNLNGACDDAGTCSCAPANGAVTVYVDADNGTDSTVNGAGRGGCAYATLDFALSQSNGEIVLTDDAYDSTNATFPITLSGNQQLRCDYDFNNEMLVTSITGNGTFGAGTAAIVFDGTTNRVIRCIVDAGGGDIGIAINSESPDDNENYHEVRQSRVTNALTGIEMTATGNVAFINRNQIQNNTTNGMLFTGDKSGYLQENTFSSNGTDIVCSEASPGLDGDSNGGPTCSTCDNCPF